MDPNSVSFIPQTDAWQFSETMRSIQQTQQDHAERLGRLERRRDSDAKVKSVWGAASPFPSGLTGTPQQGPQHPSDFSNFDDDSSANNMVRSLHLDADDDHEPTRRLNAASRANSVRFDESAKQSPWNHGQRGSIDAFSPRISSGLAGLGGLPMFERSTSHKSDGRQSSAGQSASGRANSLGLDSSQLLSSSTTDHPGLVPGLMVLGTVPAIVRCWLNQNFKHEALLYAAVCTGSYKSLVEMKLLEQIGLSDAVRQDISGNNKIKLQVYLPEATSQPVSSRPNSPAPSLPAITVDFAVVDRSKGQTGTKAIQIFLGSDMLRQHNGDVLFSSNTLALYDDDRNKLSVPLVRPENDETFKTLSATSISTPVSRQPFSSTPGSWTSQDSLKSMTNGHDGPLRQHVPEIFAPPAQPSERAASPPSKPEEPSAVEAPSNIRQIRDQSSDREPSLSLELTKATKPEKEALEEAATSTTPPKTGSSPAIWSNWRRDGANTSEWAASTRSSSSTYQRPGREMGIKVLKPSTSRSTTLKSAGTPTQSPSTPQSRFFDEGRRRTGPGEEPSSAVRSSSGDSSKTGARDNGAAGTKPRSANPIGGASAFGWLNSGQK